MTINKRPACIYIIEYKHDKIKGSYIGSTLNLKKRIKKHKYDSITSNKPLYQHIRESGGWKNWIIKPLAIITNYTDGKEYREIEKKYCEIYKTTYNINTPNGSVAEWKKKNKDKVRLHNTNFRQRNPDLVRQRAKAYNAKNKELIALRTKEWYKKNRKLILERNNFKMMCICGSIVNRSHLYSGKHKYCKKHHINAIENIKSGICKLKSNPLNINRLV